MTQVLLCNKNDHQNTGAELRTAYATVEGEYFILNAVCKHCSSKVFYDIHPLTMVKTVSMWPHTKLFLKKDLPPEAISIAEMEKQNKQWES